MAGDAQKKQRVYRAARPAAAAASAGGEGGAEVPAADADEGAVGGGMMSASSCVVLRLQIDEAALSEGTSHNFEHEFLNYNPRVTMPMAYVEAHAFQALPLEIESAAAAGESNLRPQQEGAAAAAPGTPRCPPPPPQEPKPVSYSTRCSSVLQEFEKKSAEGEWPAGTRAACFWCCHPFEGAPVALPVRYKTRGKGQAAPEFHTVGCFCSIACAAAHNLESRESHETVCDRHSLLSELSRLSRGDDRVRAAPPRSALTMFGGYMSVAEFRAAADEPVAFLENVPPMRSLVQQIEEVDENDVLNGYSFVPLDRGRAERGLEELALRRNKPLLGGKNTLDHALNLRFANM